MNDTLRINSCYAIAVGCLRSMQPLLKPNTRQSGVVGRLIKSLSTKAPNLPHATGEDREKISRCIYASGDTFSDVFDDDNAICGMINLTAFTMEEIKDYLNPNHFWNLRKLIDCFYGSGEYEDIRKSERVYSRLMAEVEIESAMGTVII